MDKELRHHIAKVCGTCRHEIKFPRDRIFIVDWPSLCTNTKSSKYNLGVVLAFECDEWEGKPPPEWAE